jgi:hypothetical protein
MTRQTITEKDGVHKEWYVQAKADTMSMETLPAFLAHLMNDYHHDYGTVCHALSAGAVATAYAMNRAEGARGGITGFQSGCVMWSFIKHWSDLTGPARLVKYEDLLYPQYDHKFTDVSQEIMNWVKAEAEKKLKEERLANVHPDVREHWEFLASGGIPFGLRLER